MSKKFVISNFLRVKGKALRGKFPRSFSSPFTLYPSPFSQGGVTLIELLVTMGIIMVVGSILLSIIVSTLRVSSKATVLSDIKQNGDTALSQMVRMVRSATSVSINPACSSTPQSAQAITVTQVDNSQTTYDCSGTTITAQQNSNPPASLLDTNAVTLTSCSITCTQQSSADYPVLQIQFTLQQKNSSAVSEKTASVPFQTSVILRNLQQ